MKESFETLNKEINELWKEHLKADFPEILYGKNVGATAFVMLDADIAGCLASFVDNENLNLYQTAMLGLRYEEVSGLIPDLSKEGSEYASLLIRLAKLVLKAVAHKNYMEHLMNQ